jgi:DNA polymerase-3 subunit epsilon
VAGETYSVCLSGYADNMNFTAIDFETATGYRNSACAVGIVTVENGEISTRYYSLIKPPDNYYWKTFTRDIHGISWRDTLNSPTVLEIYPELLRLLRGRTVVAHNAQFDKNVLINSMKYYGLDYDSLQINNWECTLQIYRHKGFSPATLDSCCKKMNIELNHHNALSDALGCAGLYLKK